MGRIEAQVSYLAEILNRLYAQVVISGRMHSWQFLWIVEMKIWTGITGDTNLDWYLVIQAGYP